MCQLLRTAEVLGLQSIAVTNCAFPLEKTTFGTRKSPIYLCAILVFAKINIYMALESILREVGNFTLEVGENFFYRWQLTYFKTYGKAF